MISPAIVQPDLAYDYSQIADSDTRTHVTPEWVETAAAWLLNYRSRSGQRWHELSNNQIYHGSSPCYQAFDREYGDAHPEILELKPVLIAALALLRQRTQKPADTAVVRPSSVVSPPSDNPIYRPKGTIPVEEQEEFIIKVSDPKFAYFVEYALRQLGIEPTEAGFDFITDERELFYEPFDIPASYLPQIYQKGGPHETRQLE